MACRMAIIKRQNATSSVEDVEKWEHLYTLMRGLEIVQSLENTMKFLKKLKERPYNPTVALLGIYSKEMKSVSCRDIFKVNVYCGVVHNSQDMGKT